jgi:hypothetical protein
MEQKQESFVNWCSSVKTNLSKTAVQKIVSPSRQFVVGKDDKRKCCPRMKGVWSFTLVSSGVFSRLRGIRGLFELSSGVLLRQGLFKLCATAEGFSVRVVSGCPTRLGEMAMVVLSLGDGPLACCSWLPSGLVPVTNCLLLHGVMVGHPHGCPVWFIVRAIVIIRVVHPHAG